MPFPLRWSSSKSSPASTAAGSSQKPKAPVESDLVKRLVDNAISDLDRRPLKSGVRVAVFVHGRLRYGFRNGFLHRCQGRKLSDIEASSSASAATPVATPPVATGAATRVAEEDEEEQLLKGVQVRFRDEKAFEDLLLEVSTAMKADHLSSALSSLLIQFAQPSWMRWSSEVPPVEVEGSTADLAKLLWAACFEREEAPAPIRGESMYDWSKDDLSTGWVIVHRVSPGIKERVAAFDKNLQQRPRQEAPAPAAGSAEVSGGGGAANLEETWVSLLIQDLCKTAEGFQETIANLAVPGAESADAEAAAVAVAAADDAAAAASHGDAGAAIAAVASAAAASSSSSGRRSICVAGVGGGAAAGSGAGVGSGAIVPVTATTSEAQGGRGGGGGGGGGVAPRGSTGESPDDQVVVEDRRKSYPSSANDFL
mmetsp:Transcript_9309/g.20554  ORF Transcript_9309/g.20554 Transcript_9309/m.20554 type:complete len:425 (+) Transcript_9309:101-1375(+)